MAHQAKWKKSVFEVYKDASINPKWTKELAKECKKNKIDFSEVLNENYINLYIGLSASDKWFK